MGVLAEFVGVLRAILDTAQKLLVEMKGFRMDFSVLTAKVAKLASDVSDEVAAGLAAVAAAQAGDQSQLDAVVASLTNIDLAVNAAKDGFTPPAPPVTPTA